MANRSVFPQDIDTFIEHYDISENDIEKVSRYQYLKTKENLTTDEINELNTLTTQLRDKIFTPEDFNKLQDCITNLETFFRDNVDGYIDTKQIEINTYVDTKKSEMDTYSDNKKIEFDAEISKFSFKDEYNPSTQYYKWNVVSLSGALYMAKQDTLGNPPTDETYWLKIAQKGDKGDTGVGLTFKGAYDNNIAYNIDDAVAHNNIIYYCINPTLGNQPPNLAYWAVFLDSSAISDAIGDLSTLITIDKSNVVSAINEVKSNIPTTAEELQDTANKVIMTKTERDKLTSLDTGDKQTVSQAEKDNWNGKQDNLGYVPVNRNGDTMTGDLTVNSGSITVESLNTDNSYVWLKNQGNIVGLLFYDYTENAMKLRHYDRTSNTLTSELLLSDNILKFDNNSIWHEGNFDPATLSSDLINQVRTNLNGYIKDSSQETISCIGTIIEEGTDQYVSVPDTYYHTIHTVQLPNDIKITKAYLSGELGLGSGSTSADFKYRILLNDTQIYSASIHGISFLSHEVFVDASANDIITYQAAKDNTSENTANCRLKNYCIKTDYMSSITWEE